jgi:FAD/FMN-containing dehydrogenase/ferredoxin
MFSSKSALSIAQQQEIESIVGRNRARFDLRERRIYSHDTSVLPRPTRLLAGTRVADGVVRVVDADEVVELLNYARAKRIPLVPRGKGTSGYGGAVPIRGGVVVDLSALKGIVGCDAQQLTVTVRAGTTWKELEDSLAAEGLSLRLYPTSAPGSTVGGWLAQGGAGLGSHAYGWFADNVCSARLVTGRGEVKEFHRKDLEGVADAEGTTGIITEVTLSVRSAIEQRQVAIAWANPRTLAEALMLITQRKLPIWSIHFVNPTSAQLRNASPHRDDGAERVAPKQDVYIALLVYDAADEDTLVPELAEIGRLTGGQEQSPQIATSLWQERFKPMRLKRLGPSLVPVEVVVPTRNVGAVIGEIERRIQAPLALEGLSVRGEEVVLLGLIPHDERTAGYTFGYGFSLDALRIAEAHGGRAYSTGAYFSGRAERVLGLPKLAVLKRDQHEHDPDGILNPGKVCSSSAVGTLIAMASSIAPIVRQTANRFGKPQVPVERPARNKQLTADVASYAYACAQCSYCVDVCPQFQEDGWESSSPRGKWFLLKGIQEGHERFDTQLRDIIGLCVQCGKCDEVCQLDLPIEPSWRKLKDRLFQGVLTRTS